MVLCCLLFTPVTLLILRHTDQPVVNGRKRAESEGVNRFAASAVSSKEKVKPREASIRAEHRMHRTGTHGYVEMVWRFGFSLMGQVQ